MFHKFMTLIKGGGDIATGIACKLCNSGFPVAITEIPNPTVIRRTVAFAEAVYSNEVTVEGITAKKVDSTKQLLMSLGEGFVPVIVDPRARVIKELHPKIIVDAIMAKHNTGTNLSNASIVIAVGPGFETGIDAHAVIETNRGHHLGKVIWNGCAMPNTGIPSFVDGYTVERVLRAPENGIIFHYKNIGDTVSKDEIIGRVGSKHLVASISGVIRGFIKEGIWVKKNTKILDIDPRGKTEYCFTISDKARAIAGGVLEAVFQMLSN